MLNLREPRLSQLAQGLQEAAHLIVGQPVLDIKTLLLRVDETGGSQDLEMLRGIGDAGRDLVGQGFDGSRSLTQQVKELQSLGRRHGFAHAGELFVDDVFEAAARDSHVVAFLIN